MVRRQKNKISSRRSFKRKGRGLLNTIIDKLPIELHVPGYNYCGPGTHLERRLLRGDKGINPLDDACKNHDIAYTQYKDITSRHAADKELAEVAGKRLKAGDATLGEKITAFGVKNIMNVKRKLGMGMKSKKRKTIKKKGGRIQLGKKRNNRWYRKRKQRIIQAPKAGGFLPFLLPILGALGAVGGGAASIAKAVNDAKTNKKLLAEQKRHDLAMEAAGKGLYLRPYKGYGVKSFLKNYQ